MLRDSFFCIYFKVMMKKHRYGLFLGRIQRITNSFPGVTLALQTECFTITLRGMYFLSLIANGPQAITNIFPGILLDDHHACFSVLT